MESYRSRENFAQFPPASLSSLQSKSKTHQADKQTFWLETLQNKHGKNSLLVKVAGEVQILAENMLSIMEGNFGIGLKLQFEKFYYEIISQEYESLELLVASVSVYSKTEAMNEHYQRLRVSNVRKEIMLNESLYTVLYVAWIDLLYELAYTLHLFQAIDVYLDKRNFPAPLERKKSKASKGSLTNLISQSREKIFDNQRLKKVENDIIEQEFKLKNFIQHINTVLIQKGYISAAEQYQHPTYNSPINSVNSALNEYLNSLPDRSKLQELTENLSDFDKKTSTTKKHLKKQLSDYQLQLNQTTMSSSQVYLTGQILTHEKELINLRNTFLPIAHNYSVLGKNYFYIAAYLQAGYLKKLIENVVNEIMAPVAPTQSCSAYKKPKEIIAEKIKSISSYMHRLRKEKGLNNIPGEMPNLKDEILSVANRLTALGDMDAWIKNTWLKLKTVAEEDNQTIRDWRLLLNNNSQYVAVQFLRKHWQLLTLLPCSFGLAGLSAGLLAKLNVAQITVLAVGGLVLGVITAYSIIFARQYMQQYSKQAPDVEQGLLPEPEQNDDEIHFRNGYKTF